MSFKLIFGITVCSSLVAYSSQAYVNGDYVPSNSYEAQYPGYYEHDDTEQNEELDDGMSNALQDLTHDKMNEIRLTKHYEEFVNGWFVNMVEMITPPLVQQSGDDQFRFPPWDQNLIRWEIRRSTMKVCWWWGYIDLLFSVDV